MIAVKAAPGSSPVPSSSPTMRMWALEDTGRNSVSPCTRPRISALTKSIALFRSVGGQKVAQHGTAEHERVQRNPLVDAMEHRREIDVGRQFERREAVSGDTK